MMTKTQLNIVFKHFHTYFFVVFLGILLMSGVACEKKAALEKNGLVSIKIAPGLMTTAKGRTHPLKAVGDFKDGKSKDITDSVTWSSSNPGIAVIDPSGYKVKALQEGTVTIIATSAQGISGTAELSVGASELVSITVLPKDISVHLGHVQQYKAEGLFSDGMQKDITPRVNWSTSNTSMPVISNTPGSKGLAISPPTGTISIIAEDPATKIKGNTSLTVTTTKLASIEVSPKNITVPLGQELPFTAVGTYVDGATSDITSSVIWTVSDPKVAGVREDTDIRGVIAALSVGKTSIKATDPTIIISSSAELTVTPPELVSIRITPSDPSLYLGDKKPLSAMGVYTDKSEKDLTASVVFSSSDPSIALISQEKGTPTSRSVHLITISNGSVEITATDTRSGISSTLPLTIKAPELVSISVKPSHPDILIGNRQTFTAIGTFADGKTKDITHTVTWTSSKPNVSNISNTGEIKGTATSRIAGETVIRASDPETGISGKAVLHAAGPTLSEIIISPADTRVSLDDVVEFKAMGKYNNGSTGEITNSVRWSASKPSMVKIDNSGNQKGRATFSAAGQVVITAHALNTGISAETTITVNPAGLTAITLTSQATTIPLGNVLPIYAKGRFADGTTQDVTRSLKFTLSDTSKATLNHSSAHGTSLVTISPGTVFIQATDPDTGIKSKINITITPSELISISVSPENPSMSLSRVQRFSATGIFSDGNRKDMTEQVKWESSSPGVARISNTERKKGRVTALSEGESVIRAIDPKSGISGETTLTSKTFWK